MSRGRLNQQVLWLAAASFIAALPTHAPCGWPGQGQVSWGGPKADAITCSRWSGSRRVARLQMHRLLIMKVPKVTHMSPGEFGRSSPVVRQDLVSDCTLRLFTVLRTHIYAPHLPPVFSFCFSSFNSLLHHPHSLGALHFSTEPPITDCVDHNKLGNSERDGNTSY